MFVMLTCDTAILNLLISNFPTQIFLFVLSPVDKATHTTNRQEDWEYIIGFCDQINKELEG